ncbi:MAG TPA: hypothetical protein VLA71_03055, partial [Algoriphagus sp.]|nr:hypothetical protein [Algoriphagus sp.]
MEEKGNFWQWLENILNENLISLGDSKLTVGLILTLILSFIALFVISEWVRRFLVKQVLKKSQIAKGT